MSAALKTGADARAMRTTKFPPQFNEKVDMTKINQPVLHKWIKDEIARILNSDDDIVANMIWTMLQSGKSPNIKQMQTNLTGFLEKDTAPFCLEMWKLLLSAQHDPNGIPKALVEAKKHELQQEKLAEERAREEAIKRQEEERERDREMARIRERERAQRGRGGGRGGRRGRDRSLSRRPASRDSRSPPGRRDYGRTDSYVPLGRGRRDENPPRRRRRSFSSDRSSRSRSPPRQRRRLNSSSDFSRSRSPQRRRSSPNRSDGADERKNHKFSRPEARRRSRSPLRRRRRSPSISNDDRSPPRRRRSSPSPRRRHSRSTSRSPPRRRNRSPDDLIVKGRALNDPRLSREGSAYSNNSSQQRGSSNSSGETANGVAIREVGNE